MGVREDIAADIATLTRAVDVPAGELAFGTDLDCVTDITEDAAELDGISPRAVAQALIRRYTTQRGSLPDDPNYGLDVRAYCNRGTTAAELRGLAEQMRAEGKKDDRVDELGVDVSVAGTTLNASVRVTPSDLGLDPFTFTFALTPDTVELLSL